MIKWFLTLVTGIPKVKVVFFMRGGQIIKFKCNKFTIRKNPDNSLAGYSYEGLRNGDRELFYVRLDAIDHINYRKCLF